MDYGAAEQTGFAFYGDDQVEDELQYEEENQPELYSGGGEDAEPPPIYSADDIAASQELKHSLNDSSSSSSAGLVFLDILIRLIKIVIIINCYQLLRSF